MGVLIERILTANQFKRRNFIEEEKKMNDGINEVRTRYLSEVKAEQERIEALKNRDPLPNLTKRLREKAAAAL